MQFSHADIGGYKWTANPKDQYIGKSLLTYGEWSMGEIITLLPFIPDTATVVEVGGNVGAHTVPLARHVRNGRVITFEPQRLCFQMLCANLINNNCINVGAYNMAAGDKAGRAQVPDLNPDQDFNFGGIGVRQETFEPVTGPALGWTAVVRLDDILGDIVIDVLKCDAEGMEAAVVRGASGVIARDKPILYLEDDRQALSRELYETVRGLGYDVWRHPVPLYRPDNLAGVAENIFGNIHSLSLFCSHPDNPSVPDGLLKLETFADHPAAGKAG